MPCGASRNETSPALPGGVAPCPRKGFKRPPGQVAMATYGARRGTGIEANGANPIVSLMSPLRVFHSSPTRTPPVGEVFARRFTCHRASPPSAFKNSTSACSFVILGNTAITTRSPSALASKVLFIQSVRGSSASTWSSIATRFALPDNTRANSQPVSPARSQS